MPPATRISGAREWDEMNRMRFHLAAMWCWHRRNDHWLLLKSK
jgi:hypothetical protein